MLISKDSQIFHSLAAISSGKNKYSDLSESILLQDFCDTVRLCDWVGIKVREAPEIRQKLIDAGHLSFDYHLQPFDEFLVDMDNIDKMLFDMDGKTRDSKREYETKLNQAKSFLAMIQD